MTAKEYLLQAESLKIRIGTMSEQLEYLRSAALYAPPLTSNMPKPSTRNVHKAEDAYVRVMEKEAQIEAAQNKLVEIVSAIDLVAEPTLQAVLSKRYLCKKIWSEISRELNFSIPRLYELHRDALAEIDAFLKQHSET